jgi:[NiFe] hydrogenase diaphorase moiety large subunit
MQGSSITPADRQRRLDAILERHGKARAELVQILREVQEPEGWVRPEAVTSIARALRLPRARVEGVAGFYGFLHLAPGGRYRLLFSDNVTDRMSGSEALLARLCELLWVECGKTSEDGLVSVDTTSCTGMCDQGPALLVNGWAIPRLTKQRVEQIAELVRGGKPLAQWPRELFVVEDNVRRRDILLDAGLAAGEPVRAALARGSGSLHESASNERSWREAIEIAPQGPRAVLE